jgi:hypothetical protein
MRKGKMCRGCAGLGRIAMRPYTGSLRGAQRGKAPLRFSSSPKIGGSKGVDGWQKAIEDVLVTVREQMNPVGPS